MRLVHQPRIVAVEIAFARLFGDAEALVIDQLGEPLLEPGGAGQRFQIGVGDDVLRLDPLRDLFVVADVVLEPAIGVGDGLAEQDLAGVGGAGLGIVGGHGLGGSGGCGERDGGGAGKRECDDTGHGKLSRIFGCFRCDGN